MEVDMANDYQFAHNIISLTSKKSLGNRLICIDPCYRSKIRSLVKRPQNSLIQKIAIDTWYLNENELIWEVLGHNDLEWPQNASLNLVGREQNHGFFARIAIELPKIVGFHYYWHIHDSKTLQFLKLPNFVFICSYVCIHMKY